MSLCLIILRLPTDIMITKIIWQTHECPYPELPQLYKSNSQTWIDGFPDWEYNYHSAKDRDIFIKDYYPEYLELYRFIKPGIYKADFWRYLIIYEFGGLYADMDSIYSPESVNPEKTVDFNKEINVSTNIDIGYQNAWIMAEPKNKVIGYVIDSMIQKCNILYDYGNTQGDMWVHATGPEMYTEVIENNKNHVHFATFPVEHAGIYKHESDIML